jgi:hypothetical protein
MADAQNLTCQCGCVLSLAVLPAKPVHCFVCNQLIYAPPEHEIGPIKPPAWVRWVALLRRPEDTGLGDTVQRIAARFGGERFKAFAARIGIPCGCTERQDDWNRQWPYPANTLNRGAD